MTVALATKQQPAGLTRVLGLYDGLASDRAAVFNAGPGDPVLAPIVQAVLAAECRWLDGHAFARWLSAWTADGTYWVPLGVHDHAAKEQALFLDDRRRLGERVWRMSDTSAWALTPTAETVRMLGSVEAWPDGGEVLASSALTVAYCRGPRTLRLTARQIHRLILDPATGEFRIRRKILLIPELMAGLPHLGWLL